VEDSNVMQAKQSTQGEALRLIRFEQVLQRTGLGRTATYDFIAKGQHPAPIKLGRASRWVVQEIDSWMEQLVHHRVLLENKQLGSSITSTGAPPRRPISRQRYARV
jgi:prophage regulatory protein